MPQDIEAVTLSALALAMDAATLRQQAIASNIANHATPGYIPQRVDFSAQMQEARRSLDAQGSIDPALLAEAQPRIEAVLDASGRPAQVHLDGEMARMAQNSLHYQALAKAMQRYFSILQSAAADGKR
ncbi:MAG TPA: flagellar basal body rod protein FlgB [Ramlibacter sp.]|uniref:flagellar basal body rod protein FlgB n=1 Tax=Ramlibacter sp. TaxID=1917967 RepID=UPI002BC283BC|nr:flagellar basal body rod protein FlgB [Ramlibacter sp.]HVZ46126.1 flagellar basal body rod protein FlgB [Ramlibacter sp.]